MHVAKFNISGYDASEYVYEFLSHHYKSSYCKKTKNRHINYNSYHGGLRLIVFQTIDFTFDELNNAKIEILTNTHYLSFYPEKNRIRKSYEMLNSLSKKHNLNIDSLSINFIDF